jgi:hypothetical protein
VTTDNVTDRSDLRLYESDGNATIRALYDQGTGFLDTCVDLLGRMINTVPALVQLQSPVTAMAIKPINMTLDFDNKGHVALTGRIRVSNLPSISSPGYILGGRLDINLATRKHLSIGYNGLYSTVC